MTDTRDHLLDLEDRHAAFIAGYDLGVIHGRANERAVIDHERCGARAGAIVARLADRPVVQRSHDTAVIMQ